MQETKIIAPLYVMLPRKTKEDRKMIINLNQYRNWYYITNNEVKKMYKEEVASQLVSRIFEPPIKLSFQLFKGSKRKTDKANVLSIHEKFFCDALVGLGCIEDDSDEFIEEQYYKKTMIDKDSPRVEITIIHK